MKRKNFRPPPPPEEYFLPFNTVTPQKVYVDV